MSKMVYSHTPQAPTTRRDVRENPAAHADFIDVKCQKIRLITTSSPDNNGVFSSKNSRIRHLEKAFLRFVIQFHSIQCVKRERKISPHSESYATALCRQSL